MLRSYKTKGGKTRWIARRGGRGVQQTFDRKVDAQDWLDDHRRNRQRANAGLEVDAGPILFRELVKLWEANFTPGKWRLDMVKYAVDRWGDVYVREMKPQGIGPWLHGLTGKNGKPLAPKTMSHILETMRQVLNAGVEWGYLTKSPARVRSFKAPSSKRVREKRPFESWDEVLRVADNCSPTGSAFVLFCCSTGLRVPSEVVDLNWSQINLTTRELRVEGTKTENAPRTVPLSSNALAALNSLPRRLSGRVFGGKTGERFDYRSWRRHEWKEALALAGLDERTPYEMRHTFATLALTAGAKLEEVSPILGHGSIDITHRYYIKWTKPQADRFRGILNTIGKEQEVGELSGSSTEA